VKLPKGCFETHISGNGAAGGTLQQVPSARDPTQKKPNLRSPSSDVSRQFFITSLEAGFSREGLLAEYFL